MITLAICTLILFFIAAVISAWIYFVPYVMPKKRMIKKSPIDSGMQYFGFVARTNDHINIDCWLIENPKIDPKGTIILCHNLAANKEKMLPYAKFLYDHGFRTILFDFRNHGDSGTEKSIWNEFKKMGRDIDAVYRYVVKSCDFSLNNVGVMGFSMGTIAAIIFSQKQQSIKAILVDSGPPLYLNDMAKRFFGRAVKLPTFPFLFIFLLIFRVILGLGYASWIKKAIRQISPRPLFFIHGDRDTFIPHKNTWDLFQRYADEPKDYWLVENTFHLIAHYTSKEQYESKVIDYFSRYLSIANPTL